MSTPPTSPSDRSAPAFRALEVHRLQDGPEPGLVLTDPFELFEGQVFVPEGLLPIVERIDGRHQVADIERALRGRGIEVPDGLVAGVVRDFDEALLLHGELFETTLERTVQAFCAAPSRPARHAGSAGYPDDPERCAAELTELIGPPLATPARTGRRSPRGVISPHVDLARGAATYAATWREVATTHPLADLYVVLGTGHRGPGRPLTGLEIDWDTPRGLLATDREFVGRVHRALGEPTDLERYLHRAEHSLEFQMLMLAHLTANRPIEARPRIAGFLCGALGHHEVDRVVGALADAAAAFDGSVCFVAGADLAHLGPAFGDQAPTDAAARQRLAERDRQRLALLQAGDALGFRASIDRDDNADRVCSVTALQLVSTLAGAAAAPLAYGQTPESPEQVVSFAGGLLGADRGP